jgi:hypothetical protein
LRKGAEVSKAIREKIAVKIGKSEKTIRTFFNQLESSGYVSSDQKKPKTYTLLYDVEEIEKKLSGILAKTESANTLMDEMRKEAQEWVKTGLEKKSLRMGETNFETKSMENTIENSLENNVPIHSKKISNPDLDVFHVDLGERNADNRQNKKLPIFQEDKSLLQCPFCKDQNKPMLFANKTDLDRHISAFHTGYSNPDYVR